jgi:hypothetical protein
MHAIGGVLVATHSYGHHCSVGMLLTSITGSVQEGDTPINWAVESIMEAGAK